MSLSRHALFIAFHYAPEASSSGVLRTLKYSRYLPEFGWRVSVVTPKVSAYSVCDARLEQQIPVGTRVIRTPYVNTKRHLSIRGVYPSLLALPDVWIGWLPWAVAAARRVMAADPVDLIYSTSPHATSHLIAHCLAMRSGLPWVADFRDPWFEDPPEPASPSGPIFRNANRWLEKTVIGRCDAVIASTRTLAEMLRSRYPAKPPNEIHAILNGYDEADFAGLPVPAPVDHGKLRIVHSGNINGQFRDPQPFFHALGRAVARGALSAHELQIEFVGGGPYGQTGEVAHAVKANGLAEAVRFLAREPYESSLKRLSSADLLLLLQASDDTASLVPAKLYEYLRAQKPLLALVPPGAVAEVLVETGGAWIADPRDASTLDAVLGEILAEWRARRLGSRRADLGRLRKFDRRVLTQQLAAVFGDAYVRRQGHERTVRLA